MAFNFEQFKTTAMDPSVGAMAGTSMLLNYFGKKDATKKKKQLKRWQMDVLDRQEAAKLNGIQYNDYLAKYVMKQQAFEANLVAESTAANSIVQGAQMGISGAQAEMIARDAEAQVLRKQANADASMRLQTAKTQVQMDQTVNEFADKRGGLQMELNQIEDPSLLAEAINTGVDLAGEVKKSEVRAEATEKKISSELDKRAKEVQLGGKIK